jgi:hypothetical protein
MGRLTLSPPVRQFPVTGPGEASYAADYCDEDSDEAQDGFCGPLICQGGGLIVWVGGYGVNGSDGCGKY